MVSKKLRSTNSLLSRYTAIAPETVPYGAKKGERRTVG